MHLPDEGEFKHHVSYYPRPCLQGHADEWILALSEKALSPCSRWRDQDVRGKYTCPLANEAAMLGINLILTCCIPKLRPMSL